MEAFLIYLSEDLGGFFRLIGYEISTMIVLFFPQIEY